MRRNLIIALIVIFGALILFMGKSLVHAQSFRTGNNATVGSGEVVDGSLYAAGRTIDIAGEVDGDVFCAGQTITVSGKVTGDVICAGQTVTISGTVEGNIRVAGQTVSVNGQIGHNATIAGQSIVTSQNSKISADVLIGGTDVTLNGPVGRDVVAGANTLTVANTIGRNIRANVGTLRFDNSAKVSGTVEYTSNNDAVVAQGAQVGTLQRKTPKPHSTNKNWTVFRFAFFFNLVSMIALLIVSVVLALLWPDAFQASSARAQARPWHTLLIGFLATIVVPVVFVTLLITVVGIPLAFLLGLAWLLVLFLSGPFFSYWLGRLIWQNGHNVVITMLAGVVLVMIVYLIPFLGVLMALAVLFMGTGIVLGELFAHYRKPNYHIAQPTARRTK